MKRKTIMCMAAALCLCSGMTAYAAPETMPDGTVFDAEYYAQMYPDVVTVLGTDENALYSHYVTYGKAEGRSAVNPLTTPAITDAAAITESPNGMPYIERLAEDVAFIGGDNSVIRKDYSDSELYQALWNQAMQNINAYSTGTKIWPDDPADSNGYWGYLVNYKFSNADWKYNEWFEIWNTVANFELDLKKYIQLNLGEIKVIRACDGKVSPLNIDYSRSQVGTTYALTAETGMIWVDHPLNGDYVVRMLLHS